MTASRGFSAACEVGREVCELSDDTIQRSSRQPSTGRLQTFLCKLNALQCLLDSRVRKSPRLESFSQRLVHNFSGFGLFQKQRVAPRAQGVNRRFAQLKSSTNSFRFESAGDRDTIVAQLDAE